MDSESALRAIVDERVAAVAARNAKPLAARQHPDIVMYNVLPPLRSRGNAAVEDATRAWFDAYASDIGYEVRELTVTVDGDVGFCSFLYHVTGTLKAGGDVDMWVRATLGCQRIGGQWLIVHDHESVPFDAATGQALIALEP
jgi:uncharacterized protein (TIGR02246 family)